MTKFCFIYHIFGVIYHIFGVCLVFANVKIANPLTAIRDYVK